MMALYTVYLRDASVVKSRIKMMKVSLAAINKKAEPVESKE